jgi:hypothetical protein
MARDETLRVSHVSASRPVPGPGDPRITCTMIPVADAASLVHFPRPARYNPLVRLRLRKPGRRLLILLLLGGFVINAIVAVGCVVLSPCLYSYDRPLTEEEIRWVNRSNERPQDEDLGVDLGCGWKEEVIYLDDPEFVEWMRDPSRQNHLVTFVPATAWRISAGLPFRSFVGEEWV